MVAMSESFYYITLLISYVWNEKIAYPVNI